MTKTRHSQIDQLKLDRLQQKIAYQFVDSQWLIQALTHRSHGSVNNERLEFLGDALLSATISERLYHQFPNVKEGVLSRLRSSLVKGETLTELAIEFSISDCLIMGAGELKSGGFRRKSILADTIEAIIGAIFLDSNQQQCQTSILHWFADRLDALSLDNTLVDPKTALQEVLQAKKLPLPIYKVENIDGASHQQLFTMSCEIALLSQPLVATASSRRQAEKQAAKMALVELEKLKNE